ncbi:glycosyltransferase family protein [Mucilaginibacter aquatilis]|uniref:Glycosyl transferase family 8 n=1 Tax=Mucilaginibacter aquatilis TaxID=1517760 RepID=A0A6I4I9N6_9SPHI|nr:hypothetical protein [Mucilaginibacter aquatilis]MVN90708.1 hypothetical protein [Mucilaginibacter aquatilis]
MAISKIVISCNAKDVYLTRICIASIRFYYEDIAIYIIKDQLRGNFDTCELEKIFDVKVINLGISKFGWGTAKLYFLLSNFFPGERIMVLDSDIVFVGRVLDYISSNLKNEEFAVSTHIIDDPYSNSVRDAYYDLDFILTKDPNFKYPGYVFNTGQMIVTTNSITKDEIAEFVDLEKFPYWKYQDKMPTVDQSLLNYILPKKEMTGELSICKLDFMIWGGNKNNSSIDIDIDDVKSGNLHQLIHWAGGKKSGGISEMTGYPILKFFEDQYYHQVKFGQFKRKFRLYTFLTRERISNSVRNVKKMVKSAIK